MLKPFLFYVVLSVVIVLFAHYAHLIIVYIAMGYTYVNLKIAPFFSPSGPGESLRQVLSLILIPLLIAAVPALIYRGIKGKTMPYFFETTWVLWLIIVLSKILVH